jgi:hypothetical protein
VSADLIAQLRALRTVRVDLGDGVAVMVTRPNELDMSRMLPAIVRGDELDDDLCVKYVTGWHGVTDAVLLGDAVGSQTPAAFSPALWREVVGNREDWARTVAGEVMRSVEAYITKRAASLGKSSGSSTPGETASYSGTTGPSQDKPSA